MFDFDTMIVPGDCYDFYGIDDRRFKLGFDDDVTIVLEALEDPHDGYRSYLNCVRVNNVSDCIFFSTPVAKVHVEIIEMGRRTGYKLVDIETNHVWLTFGTNDSDSYYPYFFFEYDPPNTPFVKLLKDAHV